MKSVGKAWQNASLAVVMTLTASCNLATDYQRPELPIGEAWRDAELPETVAVDPQWWQAFGNSELGGLMARALAYNNDLAAARQRVAQVRAQATIAASWLWPAIGVAGVANESHVSTGDSQKYSGQFDIAYEVDLWGSNRAKRDAGAARLLSERFARDALQLVVLSSVGQNYFGLMALEERGRIAREFFDNVRTVLEIVAARYQSGAASAIDVAQQKTELANAQASLDLLMQQRVLAENALSILLGVPPQGFAVVSGGFAALQLPTISPSQPVGLLQRRPDLRQAEMELIAAHADITVARAAFYPKLQLSLETLLASPQPTGVALALAASLAQPLFQGGRLEGELSRTQARQAELVEQYRQATLNALREVEDAIAIRSHSSRRLEALVVAVDEARQAYELSRQRYQTGAIDYQTLLNTQRSYLNAENAQVEARLNVLQASVQLYKALGGGWREG